MRARRAAAADELGTGAVAESESAAEAEAGEAQRTLSTPAEDAETSKDQRFTVSIFFSPETMVSPACSKSFLNRSAPPATVVFVYEVDLPELKIVVSPPAHDGEELGAARLMMSVYSTMQGEVSEQ